MPHKTTAEWLARFTWTSRTTSNHCSPRRPKHRHSWQPVLLGGKGWVGLDCFDICPTITAMAMTGVLVRRSWSSSVHVSGMLAFEDGLLYYALRAGKQQPLTPIRSRIFNNDSRIWSVLKFVLNLNNIQVISLLKTAQESISCGAMSLAGVLSTLPASISIQRQ